MSHARFATVAALAAVLAGATLVSGCESTARSVAQDRGGYSPAEFRFATENKDLLVEIAGNPFATDPAAFGALVEAAMQPAHWGFDQAFTPRTHPALRPGPSANLDYRVAVVFGGPALEAPALMCAGPDAQGSEPTATPIRARMAFCRDRQLLSTSYGTLDQAAGPDDRRFLALISRLTSELFPHRDFRDGDSVRPRRIT